MDDTNLREWLATNAVWQTGNSNSHAWPCGVFNPKPPTHVPEFSSWETLLIHGLVPINMILLKVEDETENDDPLSKVASWAIMLNVNFDDVNAAFDAAMKQMDTKDKK